MPNSVTGITTSTFKYESDIPEKLGKLKENLLNFTTEFESGDFYRPQIKLMAEELEETAKFFATEYGLGGTNLYNHIRAEPQGSISVKLTNDARDNYNRFYAGFVEYGHRAGDKYVPARPFMRQALRTVSQASIGDLSELLSDMIIGTASYDGVHKLQFGKGLSRKNRVVDRILTTPLTMPVSGQKYSNFSPLGQIGKLGSFHNFKHTENYAHFRAHSQPAYKRFKKLNKKAKKLPVSRKTKKDKKDKTKKGKKGKKGKKQYKRKTPKKQLNNSSFFASMSQKDFNKIVNGKTNQKKSQNRTRRPYKKRTKKTPVSNINKVDNYHKVNSPDGTYKDSYGRKFYVVNGRVIKTKKSR